MAVANKNASHDGLFDNRTVIPKWKAPNKAIETDHPNTDVLARRKVTASKWGKQLLSSYNQAPSVSSANELYELAMMYKGSIEIPNHLHKSAIGLRNRILAASEESTKFTAEKDNLEVGESLNNTHNRSRESISKLKATLRENPEVPFAWSELSRNYLVVGEPSKAMKAMQCAIKLAKNNRYIQRAATRLFVHLRESDRALNLLRSSPMVIKDPWLLSAEIATTSKINKTSPYVSKARELLESTKFDDYQKSELASALGTLELEHGVTKKAKELFKRSLFSPTENSLAQAQWASNNDSKIIIPQEAWTSALSHEALTLAARHDGRWEDTLKECACWLSDEPYSIQAAILGSYIGFWPGTHSRAEQFATAGLLSENNNCDSTNIMLLNNRAVARAYQGNLNDAYSDFESAIVLSDGKDSTHLLATLGLIAYRSGIPDLGADCYLKSIAWFNEIKDKPSAALAMMFFLREYTKVDKDVIPLALDMSKKIYNSPLSQQLPELKGVANLIISEIDLTDVSTFNHKLNASKDTIANQAKKFSIPNKSLISISTSKDPARFLSLLVQKVGV